MDHSWNATAEPEWHDHASQYGVELAARIAAASIVERFDAGKSFERDLTRIRYKKNDLVLIVEFCESSELFVEDDAEAIDFAFIKADPFDGSTAVLPIEKIRQAYRHKVGQTD